MEPTIENSPHYIEYSALRQPKESYYPTGNCPHFHNPKWDEQLETNYSHGEQWYNHFTDAPDHKLPHLLHKSNEEGRNSKKFYSTPDIITAGCSVTAGVGLPHNFLWPEIIETITHQKINNVSRNGASVARIVYETFLHIKKYGTPKKIFLLTPELSRGWLQRNEQNGWGPGRDLIYDPENKTYSERGGPHKKAKHYIHKTLDNNKTLIPLDVIVSENLRALEHLCTLTDILNIELKIYSWDNTTNHELNKIGYPQYQQPLPNHTNPNKKHAHYTPQQIGPGGWGWPKPTQPFGTIGCCELQPQNKYQKLMWNAAADSNKKSPRAHPGLHAHIHTAEIFLQTTINETDYKNIQPWYTNTHLDTL